MEMKLTLAERLKDERKSRKLTMEQVEKETGRIRAFNAQLRTARNEVARQFSPDENEIGMRTLEAGQIDQHKYMGDIISEDLMTIARDIREAHNNDFGVTSDDDLAKQAEENAKQVLNFGGSMTDQAIHMICLQLGIDFEKVNALDRAVLKRVLKMSPMFQTAINQRGRK